MKERNGAPKQQIADALKARLYYASRRLALVQFDAFMRLLREELDAGTIPKIGKQRSWARYFFERYIFVERANGVDLYNAIWRAGPDRRFPRPSDNPPESYNNKIKAAVKRTTQALLAGQSANARPSLPELIQRLEHCVQIDSALSTKPDEEVLHRVPAGVDTNLLTGHSSIWRHTSRLPVKAWLQGGARPRPEFLRTVRKGVYEYYIMSFGCEMQWRGENASLWTGGRRRLWGRRKRNGLWRS